MNLLRIGKGIMKIAGIKIWTASLVPMFVAAIFAYTTTKHLEIKWLILSVIGVFLVETGKHCFNDLVDYKSGVDLSLEKDKITPFSGGKKVLTENLLTIKEAKYIGIITSGIALGIGVYIATVREPRVFMIALIGLFFACAYSLPPFSLCYRGLGEAAVGITYGPLLLSGMYMVLTQEMEPFVLLLSIPLGILITNVLWINQYPDYEADKKNNKQNWVVRLGKRKSLRIYFINYILTYIFLILIAISTQNFLWLLSIISIPLAYQSYQIAKKYYLNIPKMIKANQMTIHIYQLTGASMGIVLIMTDLIK